VANGVVYVGSTDDHVYALNARTGDEIWQFLSGGFVESSPALETNPGFSLGIPGEQHA